MRAAHGVIDSSLNSHRCQAEDVARFLRTCGVATILSAQITQSFYQLCIAFREAIAVKLDIVFKACTHMPSECECPLVDLELVTPDAGGCPGGIGHDVLELRHQKLQHLTPCRQGIRNAHDELQMQRLSDQSALGE